MNLHWPGIRLSWIYPGACYPDLGAAPFRIDYGRHEFHSNHPSCRTYFLSTVKQGELAAGTFRNMLKQLDIPKEDF